MDWSAFWTSLLTSIGGTTVLVTLLAWLGKSWLGTRIRKSVEHEYDKKLEDHKAQLQQQNADAVQKMQERVQAVLDEKAADKALFQQFLQVLPSNGSIEFIRHNNMAGFSFRRNSFDQLHDFEERWGDAEHEFLDPELESKRKALHAKIRDYTLLLAENTWTLDSNTTALLLLKMFLCVVR